MSLKGKKVIIKKTIGMSSEEQKAAVNKERKRGEKVLAKQPKQQKKEEVKSVSTNETPASKIIKKKKSYTGSNPVENKKRQRNRRLGREKNEASSQPNLPLKKEAPVVPPKPKPPLVSRPEPKPKNIPKPDPVRVGLSKRDRRSLAKSNYGVHKTHVKFKGDYKRKREVDYDVVFCISSFNRFEKVYRLIEQIYTQPTVFKFKVILYNDGSTEGDYNKIAEDFPHVDYVVGGENNGKVGYYKSITKVWQAASKYMSHTICQCDDDFILCNNFIDSLMNLYFKVKPQDNRIVSIYYHKTSERNKQVDVFRVDGGTMYDRDFLEMLDFTVPQPSKRQMTQGISSGVWRFVSESIRGNGLVSHRTDISFVRHDGNDDSKMHPEHRKEAPIHSHQFKDDIEK
jgi:hypothetical protein